jgi:hypothetical protein
MLGMGGHAAVLLDSIAARKDIVVRFGLDISSVKWGKTFCGLLVKGGDELLSGSRTGRDYAFHCWGGSDWR